MHDSEQWLPVTGWEGFYEVSDRGLIRSVDRMVPEPRWGFRRYRGRPIAPWRDRNGYFLVNLYRDAKPTRRFVHQLVLEAFAGLCPPGMESLHGMGGKTDNRWPENLHWGTHAENCADTARQGMRNNPVGERSGSAKLTGAIVREVRIRRAGGEKIAALAREFGVNRGTMTKAIDGRNWGHI